MSTKYRINPLTMNLDMISDGESGAVKQMLNPLTGNFDMVGEGDVKMKYNPFTSNFDMVAEGGGGGGWQPDPSRTLFYYDFEQNLNDSSGNGNNIISSSNVTYAQVGGQYVALSGTTPIIATDPSYSTSIGTGDFAISFWIYPVDSGTNTPMMFGIFSEDRPDYAGPTIFMDTDKTMIVRMTASNSQQTSETLAMNTWQHIVMTRNSGTVKFYLDNTEILNWSDNTSLEQNNMLAYIFSRGDANQRFYEGAMGDKFILENVGWSATDVTNYYNQTKSLYEGGGRQPGEDTMFYYKFDGDLTDEMGNYDLSQGLSSQTITYGTTAGGAKYAYFPTDCWTSPSAGITENWDEPHTLSLWINLQSEQETGIAFDLACGYPEYPIWERLYGNLHFAENPDYQYNAEIGTWYNIILVRDDTSNKIYINGELIHTGTPGAIIGTETLYMVLNNAWDTDQNYYAHDFYLSELISESKGWTQQDVTNYYNGTKDNYISQNVTVTITTADYNKGIIQDSNGNTAVEQYAQVPDGSSIDYENEMITLSSGRYVAVPYDGYRFQGWIPQILTATEDANIYAYWQNCMKINGPDWMSNVPELSCPAYVDGEGSITVHGNFSSFEVRVANISGDPNNPESPLVYYMNGSQIPFDYDPISDEMYIRYGTNFSDSIGIELASGQGTTTFDVIYQFVDSGDVINDQWTLQEPQQSHAIYVDVNDADHETSEILITVPDDLPSSTQSFTDMVVKNTDFVFFHVYVPNIGDSNNPIPGLIVSVTGSYISGTYDSDWDAFIVDCGAILASQDDITIEIAPELDYGLTFSVDFSFDGITIHGDEWILHL